MGGRGAEESTVKGRSRLHKSLTATNRSGAKWVWCTLASMVLVVLVMVLVVRGIFLIELGPLSKYMDSVSLILRFFGHQKIIMIMGFLVCISSIPGFGLSRKCFC